MTRGPRATAPSKGPRGMRLQDFALVMLVGALVIGNGVWILDQPLLGVEDGTPDTAIADLGDVPVDLQRHAGHRGHRGHRDRGG